MNFGQAISTCLSKYANFNGRATRPEFWWFFLFQILLTMAAGMLGQMLSGLIGLVLLLPSIAVATRRLHDVGRSGWWQLLSLSGIGLLVLIYWWVQPSADGANEYDAVTV